MFRVSKYGINTPTGVTMKTISAVLFVCVVSFAYGDIDVNLDGSSGRIEDDGDVYVDGSYSGRIEDDGDVYVDGVYTGRVEEDGDIYVNGSYHGRIEDDGDLYIDGSYVGQIENDGDIYVDGSYEGNARGMPSGGARPVAGYLIFFSGFPTALALSPDCIDINLDGLDGRIESDGDVYVGGSYSGRIEDDGDVYVDGSYAGRIEDDGDIYVNGSYYGRVEEDGDVYIGGSYSGRIEEDGDIYIDGSYAGTAYGMPFGAEPAVAIYLILFADSL
jgi:cytoskeletal protein CcmA (bactofilin family)